jgi:hypothetical protein
MIRIMQEYGSEVSNQTLPKRKDCIKKASIVRQFRRWNPEFFRYFIHGMLCEEFSGRRQYIQVVKRWLISFFCFCFCDSQWRMGPETW